MGSSHSSLNDSVETTKGSGHVNQQSSQGGHTGSHHHHDTYHPTSYSHTEQHRHDGDSDESDEDHHDTILSDSLNDVHCHDDLYDHFSDTYHSDHLDHHAYHHHELQQGDDEKTGHHCWESTSLQHDQHHPAVAGGAGGAQQHEHHKQSPSLGSTLQSLTNRFFGSDHDDADKADDETVSLALRVFDHVIELASMQGQSESPRHGHLEYEISKATLRLAMATLAERRRDEEHLDHGSGAGLVSKFDGKPLWSFLRAPQLTLADRWSKMFHRSYFDGYQTVRNLNSAEEYHRVVDTGVTQGYLTKFIYDNEHGLDKMKTDSHQTTVVAEGRSGNIRWCITEGDRHISEFYNDEHHQNDNVNVLTVTLRGYTVEDEKVDKEKLLVDTASAKPMKLTEDLIVHSGLYHVVKQIYDKIKPYLYKKRDDQRIVFCGHSLGGMSSVLLLMMLTLEKGADWVMTHVLRAFTFGAPPVLRYVGSRYPHSSNQHNLHSKEDHEFFCPILASVGLPPSIVYGYVQPWDPIPRMFSEVDAFHHAVDDVGKDGYSLLSSGSFRMARVFVAAAAKKSPEVWAQFRDTFRACAHQHYQSVGIQHLLMPSQRTYFCDLFAHVDLRHSHIHSVLRIDGSELYSALYDHFPLDSYCMVRTSNMIRCLLHHLTGSYVTRFHVFQELTSSKVHSSHGAVPKSSWLQ